MRIELKSLKVARALSEETVAFTADLYVNGFRAYAVSNRGCGGCNSYHSVGGNVPTIQAIESAIVAAGNAKCGDFEILDCYLGDLIAKVEAKKILDRYLKSRITVITDKGLATYPTKYKPTTENIAAVAAQLAKKGDASVIVNGNPAVYDRALALV